MANFRLNILPTSTLRSPLKGVFATTPPRKIQHDCVSVFVLFRLEAWLLLGLFLLLFSMMHVVLLEIVWCRRSSTTEFVGPILWEQPISGVYVRRFYGLGSSICVLIVLIMAESLCVCLHTCIHTCIHACTYLIKL